MHKKRHKSKRVYREHDCHCCFKATTEREFCPECQFLLKRVYVAPVSQPFAGRMV